MAAKHDLGKESEELASQLLIKKGFEILEQNYRFGNKEIDIIAKQNNLVVFVEVKARSTNFFGEPESAISAKKLENISQAAIHYLEQKQWNCEVRFDAISIIKNKNKTELVHFEDIDIQKRDY